MKLRYPGGTTFKSLRFRKFLVREGRLSSMIKFNRKSKDHSLKSGWFQCHEKPTPIYLHTCSSAEAINGLTPAVVNPLTLSEVPVSHNQLLKAPGAAMVWSNTRTWRILEGKEWLQALEANLPTLRRAQASPPSRGWSLKLWEQIMEPHCEREEAIKGPSGEL